MAVLETLAAHPHDSTAHALAQRVSDPHGPAAVMLALCRLAEDGLLVRSGAHFGLSARGWRTLRSVQRAERRG
ncbi:MAG: hypothetical protein JWO02_2202 [Solirubrobacterales bacterium]|nr:hypothetical protein [Solirubrobacterales bacterium]